MNRWTLFALLAGLSALWLSYGFMKAPYVSDDGTQYIDAAEHLRAGECLCTNVAHFDEQVAHGNFPVPLTHFAPGYSILTASLSLAGIKSETAAYLIAAFAFLAILPAMWDIALRLGVRPFAMVLVSLVWLTNDLALAYTATVGTDILLTAVVCVTVALVVRDIQTNYASRVLPWAIGIGAAAAYWVKYGGLFVMPVAILYLLWSAWRTREFRLRAAAIAAALLLSAPIPIHNILYEGSWKGGFNAGRHHSARFAVVETFKAIYHLIFGANVLARWDVWAVIAILSFVAVAILTLRRRRFPRPLTALIWIGLFVVGIASGNALASTMSIAADLLRYNMPIYPLLLVAGAALFMPSERVELAWFSLLILAILVIQSRSLVPSPVSPSDQVQMVLSQEVEPGVSMRRWLEDRIPPANTIAAVDGQALHQVLKRPVVSIIDPVFRDRQTDEAEIESLMKQFHARYLVVYPGWSANIVPEQHAIPFLRNLASGMAPPWLTFAARTRNVAVFRCDSCLIGQLKGGEQSSNWLEHRSDPGAAKAVFSDVIRLPLSR